MGSHARQSFEESHVETRTGDQARLPELRGAVLRLGSFTNHLSGLPSSLPSQPALIVKTERTSRTASSAKAGDGGGGIAGVGRRRGHQSR